MILIFFSLFIGIFRDDYCKVGNINSFDNKSQKWDSSKDPIILMQLTDVHLNAKHLKTAGQFKIALQQANEIYHPSSIVLSGDVCDNKDETKDDIGYGDQHEKDFILYEEMIDSSLIDVNNLIDISGNHDEYGVGDFESSHHNMIKFSKYFKRILSNMSTIEDFWFSKYETTDYEIISLNPYWFPVPHAKLAFNISPDKKFLDVVENRLKNSVFSKLRIVQCHFPLNLWLNNKKSSNKKTIEDILNENNISIFLSGHFHPKEALISHHAGMLEIVCGDLKTHKRIGLISIDNNRVAFHDATIDKPLMAIVTNPVPINQSSSQLRFNEEGTDIRVVVFKNQTKNKNQNKLSKLDYLKDLKNEAESYDDDVLLEINAKIYSKTSGEIEYEGKLTKQKDMAEGYSLYSLKMPSSGEDGNISFGEIHHLSLSGDFVYEMDFVLNDSVFIPDEKNFVHTSWRPVGYVALGLVWSILFIITIPYNFSIGEKINNYIYNTHCDSSLNDLRGILYSMFLGPFAMNNRVSKLSRALRYYLFFLVCYPIIMPSMFIKIEKYVGIVWTYGYVVNGCANFDLWGIKYTCLYVLVFVLSAVTFASALSTFYFVFTENIHSNNQNLNNVLKKTSFLAFDLCLYLVGLGSTFFVDYFFVIEAVDFLLALLSPMFILLPVATTIWFIVDAILKIRKGGLGSDYTQELQRYSKI